MSALSLGKDLVGLEPLSAEQIRLILDTAEPFKEVSERPIKKVPALRGKTIVNLFFEASTRTRISFEFAEKRLSADTVNVATAGSSVSKGETLVDTARNLEAMRIDMVVIRHGASGAAQFLGQRIRSNVINAGDGKHEHPTQGLLDILTLRDRFKRIEGLKIAICGDIPTAGSLGATSGDCSSWGPRWVCADRRRCCRATCTSSVSRSCRESRTRFSGRTRSTCSDCSSSGCSRVFCRRSVNTTGSSL